MHAGTLPPRQHRRPAFLVARVRSGGGAGSRGCSGTPWPEDTLALAAEGAGSLSSFPSLCAGGCGLPALGVGIPASRPDKDLQGPEPRLRFLCSSSGPFPHHPRLGQSWVGGAEQRTGLAASPALVLGGLASVLGGLTSVILFNPWMRASVLSLYGEGN